MLTKHLHNNCKTVSVWNKSLIAWNLKKLDLSPLCMKEDELSTWTMASSWLFLFWWMSFWSILRASFMASCFENYTWKFSVEEKDFRKKIFMGSSQSSASLSFLLIKLESHRVSIGYQIIGSQSMYTKPCDDLKTFLKLAYYEMFHSSVDLQSVWMQHQTSMPVQDLENLCQQWT